MVKLLLLIVFFFFFPNKNKLNTDYESDFHYRSDSMQDLNSNCCLNNFLIFPPSPSGRYY